MARNRVKRFLENLHLRVIVLAEQPDESKTVIEKFEANADVGYAVILLTGDDWGALNGRGRTQGLKQSHRVESRARQNVIFKWGFFLGRLGRRRVSVSGPEEPRNTSLRKTI